MSMETHRWMLQYTRQTEWIDRRGLILWIAFYTGGLGGGLYLVSLFFNSIWGMFIGWIIVAVIKGGAHLLYLGKPLRFWRAIPPFTRAWRTSWITRGLFFTTLFIGFAFVQIVLAHFFPGTGWGIALKVITGTIALPVLVYSGFAMSYCRSVPLWNSALLPLVFIFAGVANEWGLLGSVSVLALFLWLLAAILGVALRQRDPAGRLICIGVFAMFGFQTFINIAMTARFFLLVTSPTYPPRNRASAPRPAVTVMTPPMTMNSHPISHK